MFAFKSGHVPDELFGELGFRSFLAGLITENIPSLPQVVLEPMESGDLQKHFEELRQLERTLMAGSDAASKRTRDEIRRWAKVLPPIEHVFAPLQQGGLELCHLFALKAFVDANDELSRHERAHAGLGLDFPICARFKTVLDCALEVSSSGLRLRAIDPQLLRDQNRLSARIESEERLLEEQVFGLTGVRMNYQLPLEIGLGDPRLERLESCERVSILSRLGGHTVTIVASSVLEELYQRQTAQLTEINARAEEKLDELSRELHTQASEFADEVQRRSRRVLQYLLIEGKQRQKLVWPAFNVRGVRLEGARLPALERLKGHDYRVLQGEFSAGVNVVLGTNMAGKTSVLKTLYFALTLVRFGLPVPAAAVELDDRFSGRVFFHLRSSGRFENDLSSFTDELHFLAQEFKSGDVVIVDELMQSTNLSSGGQLSKAILAGLAHEPWCFVCSSHHFDCLQVEGARFFKMGQGETRFSLLRVEARDVDIAAEVAKPLKLALGFKLPASVLAEIQFLNDRSLNDRSRDGQDSD